MDSPTNDDKKSIKTGGCQLNVILWTFAREGIAGNTDGNENNLKLKLLHSLTFETGL